jgi:hypothetical protein
MFEKFPLIYAFNKGGTGGGGGCSSIDIENSDGSYTETITCAQSPFELIDTVAVLKDSASNTISTTFIPSCSVDNITAPDAVYRNDSTTPSYTQNIKSGETFTAPNIVLTQPNGATENKLPNINLSCTQINALDNSDLVAQLLAAQIVAVYGGRISINVRQYTADDTYTKPSNLLFAHVLAVGGGGGGASGEKRPNGTISNGGGGGGCGAVARRILQASEIGGTETITIGTGGNGGASVTTNNTAGNNGANGGDTSFGSLVIAKGGLGAVGQAAGATVAFNLSTPNTNGLNIMGANGYGGGITGAGTSGLVMTNTSFGVYFGGSGGGGISNATPGTQNAGGARTRIYDESNTLSAARAGGTAGGGNGDNGIDNYALQIGLHPTRLHTIGLGVSGVGGGSANNGTTNGGNGGNGGLYGAGGGGGGAARDGTAQSGAGGNGAQGCLIIYEFLIV